MKHHKDDNYKAAQEKLPLVASSYDTNMALISGILLLVVFIILLAVLAK